MNRAWRSIVDAAAAVPPDNGSEGWLKRCLARNAGTQYGLLHRFHSIRDVDDYRTNVPMVTYDNMEPLLNRIRDGEADVLFAGTPVAFERTGGSGGGEKIIPYSTQSIVDFRYATLPWLASFVATYGLGNGRAYLAVSPALRRAERTATGIPIGLPDGSYLGEDLLPVLAELSILPPAVGSITCFSDWQLATLFYMLQAEDLELIFVWSPTFLIRLLDGIAERKCDLAVLLREGGTVAGQQAPSNLPALRRLESYDGFDTTALWPRLKLLSCWTDSSSALYAMALAQRVPQAAIQGKGLLLTEGVVTIPGENGLPLPITGTGFTEFLDESGRSRLVQELEEGQTYEVVMTTSGGLYRYRAGDCVRCDGFVGEQPILRFTGRCGSTSDLVGEKLADFFVAECMRIARCRGILTPIREPGPGYLLLAEDAVTPDCLAQLEDALCRNPHYSYARKIGQLQALRTQHVPDLAIRWADRAVSEGMRLGDVKMPALCPDLDILSWWKER